MFENPTKNQHFVSQVEQRFNAIDNSVEKNKQRIFEFEVKHDDTDKFILSEDNGIKIQKNLSWHDLYTFDEINDVLRLNFENYFSGFESRIFDLTEKITKSDTIDIDDFLNLVFAKFLNIIRNPYCIKGTLKTFGMLADQYPLESSLLLQYRKIENFVVSSEIIEELEVSELEFRSWLKIIFHLVVNYKYENNGKKEDFNILKEIVKSLLNPREKFIIIQLFSYSNNICVLSDRGHNNLGSVFGPNEMCLEFNLTKHDFLRMYIINNDFEVMGGIVSNASEIIENLKSSGYKRAKREKIIIDKYMDDIKSLRSFNKRSISQCLKNFYCSTTNIDI